MKKEQLLSGSMVVAIAVAAGRQMYRRGRLPALRAEDLYASARGRGQGQCDDRAMLPGRLVASALLLNGGQPNVEDMPEIEISCALERHTTGAHFGFVRQLEWEGTGSVWGCWKRGSTAVNSLALMPLCPDKREGGKYFCARIAHHLSGHDWELSENWLLSHDVDADDSMART